MMRKILVLGLALLLAFSLTSRAEAGVNYKFDIDGLKVDADGQMRHDRYVQNTASNITVTAAQSGGVFILEPTLSNLVVTLPSAVEGMTYKFIDANGDYTFWLVPNSADIIEYSATFGAGDILVSAGDIHDTVTIYATSDTNWAVETDITCTELER